MANPHPIMPVVLAAAGIATFGVMDALMKSASLESGVYSALLWRSLIGTGLMLPVWRLSGGRTWPSRATLALHALRAGVIAGMALLFFWGLVRTPMAVGIALSFIAPLIALYLAALLLGEPITRRALLASLLGLAGVGVIAFGRIGPENGGSVLGMAAILGSSVLYAGNLVLQRHQAQRAAPAEVALFQSGFMALIMLPAAPWLAVLPGGTALANIAGSAVLSAGSMMMLSWAYARAEAHRLLPIEYSAFIWAALMGWLWFGEGVSAATLLGAGLIVIGCALGAGRARPGDHVEQTAL